MSTTLNSIWPGAAAFGAQGVRTLSPAIGPASMLRYAWTIEVCCIAIGFSLAIAAGYENAVSFWAAQGAALPFAAAAIVETGRIPLVRGFFLAKGMLWRGLALGGVLILGVLTFENLVFGFERAFAVRLEDVRQAVEHSDEARKKATASRVDAAAAGSARVAAKGELDRLDRQRADATQRASAERDSAAKVGETATEAAKSDLAVLEQQRAAMVGRHSKEVASQWAFCRSQEIHPCTGLPGRRHEKELKDLDAGIGEVRRLRNDRASRGDTRQQAAVNALGAEIATIDTAAKETRQRLEIDDAALKEANARALAAETVAHEAEATAERLRRQSQMHRLAKIVFGAASDDNAARTLGLFATVSAAVLAVAGSLLAAVHFRLETQPADSAVPRRRPLERAFRATLARLRRGKAVERLILKEKRVEVPVEVQVVKVVEKSVEVAVGIAIPVDASIAERAEIVRRAMEARPGMAAPAL